jgi:OFA family oxalate/formate antiporter-like MFS transporter
MNILTRRIVFLVVGFVLLLLTGLIYAWSIFIVPLESEFGWVRAETSTIFTITMMAFCLGGMINGIIIGRTSPRFTLWVAMILFFVGFFFASRTEVLWQIFISYGVLVGFGVGLVYNTVISTITKWFPDKKGFASGVSLMGFGLGAFILGTIASKILEVSDWRIVFIAFAIAFPVLVFISSLIIRNPKENERDSLPKPKARLSSASPKEVKDITPIGMLKTPVFWIFLIWSLVLSAAGLIIIGHASPIAEGFTALPISIPMAVGTITICNGIARVFYGMLFDRFGVGRAIYAVALNGVVASVLMAAAVNTGSEALVILGFVLTGTFYGGTPTTNSTFVMSQYGQKNFAVNFSVVNLQLLLAPIIGSNIAASLFDSVGSYIPATYFMVGYTALALVLSFIISLLIKQRNSQVK